MKVCAHIQPLTSSTDARCFARLASCLRWRFLSWREPICSCFLCRVLWSCRRTGTMLKHTFCLPNYFLFISKHYCTKRSRFSTFSLIRTQIRKKITLFCTVISSHFTQITSKMYHMVDFQRISQHSSLALGDALPHSFVLSRWITCFGRRANQTVLWWQVPLRGERRYDISLEWYQFCWGQTALQCSRRIWQRRQTTGGLSFQDKKMIIISSTDSMAHAQKKTWFALLTCHKVHCIISKILVICIGFMHLWVSKTDD